MSGDEQDDRKGHPYYTREYVMVLQVVYSRQGEEDFETGVASDFCDVVKVRF